MAFTRSRRTHHTTHTTQPTYVHKPSLLSRLTRRKPRTHATTTTTRTTRRTHRTHHAQPVATTAPLVHHQRRRPSLGDKVSGAILKLKGSLTRKPGQKAAGTRRMHGTDGRGTRRVY
jgi:hypothetical protein